MSGINFANWNSGDFINANGSFNLFFAMRRVQNNLRKLYAVFELWDIFDEGVFLCSCNLNTKLNNSQKFYKRTQMEKGITNRWYFYKKLVPYRMRKR